MSFATVVSLVLVGFGAYLVSCQQWVPAQKVHSDSELPAGIHVASSAKTINTNTPDIILGNNIGQLANAGIPAGRAKDVQSSFKCCAGLRDTNARDTCPATSYCSLTVYGVESTSRGGGVSVSFVGVYAYNNGEQLQTMRGCGCPNQPNTYCCQGSACNCRGGALFPSSSVLLLTLVSSLVAILFRLPL